MIERRRILYLITDLDAGGAEKTCTNLATRLDRTRWQPAVCSLMPAGPLAERLRACDIPVYSLGANRTADAPAALIALVRLLHQTRPEILHTFLFHANCLGRVAGAIARVPTVVSSIRVAERRYRYHLILENLTCRLCDRIVCVSDAVRDFSRHHAHIPASRLVTIPNGIEFGSSASRVDRESIGVPRDAIMALFVGRLDHQKGVDVLLRATAAAIRSEPRLHLVIAGTGPDLAALQELACNLGALSYVHFIGWRPDVPELLAAADLFVLPSRWEGMPNAVLEAMAAGLPVIATRTEGTSELVHNGVTGLLVAIDDETQLAEAIQRLARDGDRRARLGRAGSQHVHHHYSLQQMIDRYQQLYDSLIASH